MPESTTMQLRVGSCVSVNLEAEINHMDNQSILCNATPIKSLNSDAWVSLLPHVAAGKVMNPEFIGSRPKKLTFGALLDSALCISSIAWFNLYTFPVIDCNHSYNRFQ